MLHPGISVGNCGQPFKMFHLFLIRNFSVGQTKIVFYHLHADQNFCMNVKTNISNVVKRQNF